MTKRSPIAAMLLLAACLAGCGSPASPLQMSATQPSSSLAGASQAASRAAEAALASAALPPVRPMLILHGPRTRKVVALTFDLCATEDQANKLDTGVVRTLEAKRAAATFFMGGLWAKDHPREAARLASRSFFEIGNHSMTHTRLTGLPAPEVRAEIQNAQTAVRDETGRTPVFFRFPFEQTDARTLGILAHCGLTAVSEDVRTGDPDPNISANRIVEYVLATARPGSIVIMHANGNGVHTAAALPRVIDGLRRKGFALVTMSELVGTPSGTR